MRRDCPDSAEREKLLSVIFSLLYLLAWRVLAVVMLRFRKDHSKELEIVVLRHELAILRRQVARPELKDVDRVFLAAASRLLSRHRWSVFFVRPEPVLRWHRRLVARHWTYPRRGPGRPPIAPEVRALIVRMLGRTPGGGTCASKVSSPGSASPCGHHGSVGCWCGQGSILLAADSG